MAYWRISDFFSWAIVVVLLGALWYFLRYILNGDVFTKLGTALLVSGALGNGWDRYHLGAVVDFFDFRIWPIFNVADIGICVGVVLLAIMFGEHRMKEVSNEIRYFTYYG